MICPFEFGHIEKQLQNNDICMTMGIGDITIVKSTETWDYKKKR